MASENEAWVVNAAMRERMARLGDSPGTVPADVEDELREGLAKRDGCLVLRAASSPSGRADFPDATSYEAFINHVHLDLDPAAGDPLQDLRDAFATAGRIANLVREAAGKEVVRVVIGRDEADHINSHVRFHVLRPGLSWLADDIEGYAEPVAFRDLA